jgi:hypothetical protein
MTFRWLGVCGAAACLLFAALPAVAHHSFSAEYDDSKPVKVTGVITKVEWLNPHIWIYLDVKGPDGKVTNWAFSGGAPGQLMRRGVSKDAIKPGTTINVDGFRAKDGSNKRLRQQDHVRGRPQRVHFRQ